MLIYKFYLKICISSYSMDNRSQAEESIGTQKVFSPKRFTRPGHSSVHHWGCLLEIHIGDPYWRFTLEIHIGDSH